LVVKATVEQELKFKGKKVSVEALGGSLLRARTFTTIYHDTADRRLLRAGLTLRHRQEDGRGSWQVKLPAEGGRVEVEETGEPAGPPESVRALLSGVLRGENLEPIATMRTHRRGRRVQGVDVTVDEVEVIDGGMPIDRFTEIEAELVDGYPAAMARVGRKLRRLGASELRTSKLSRVVVAPSSDRPKRGAPAVEHLRAMVSDQYQELVRNDPIVRLGEHADAVHDMRVAVRRLRSILRSAAVMLELEWVEHVRGELDWLAGKLGAVRDLDVLGATLTTDAAGLDGGDATLASVLLHPLRQEHEGARKRLLAALENPRYYQLLDIIESATRSMPVTENQVTLRKMARKEFKKLRRRAKRLDELNDAALHKMRIQGKRARYAAELAGRERGKKAARFVSAARDLQDVLGANQDAVVAVRQLRELAGRTDRTDTALVAGRLIERQRSRKRSAHRKLSKTWRRVDRRGKRAWA
jgi:CHAD domain-containing protein